MNERFEKLLAEAFFDEAADQADTKVYELNDAMMQKFAELIVKECIDKITSYDLTPGHSAKWEDIYEIHARLLQDLGDELKEHFGVNQ